MKELQKRALSEIQGYQLLTGSWQIGGKKTTLTRLTFPFPCDDLLGIFSAQDIYPKCYFSSLEIFQEIIAFGALEIFEKIPSIKNFSPHLIPHTPRLFGGMDFFGKERKTALWDEFPKTYFFLPQFEMIRENGITLLSIHLLGKNPLDAFKPLLQNINLDPPLFSRVSKPLQRLDFPTKNAWQKNVEFCLDLFKKKTAKKIVLARTSQFQFSEKLNPFALLKSLESLKQTASIFAFSINAKKTFLGASPENLYMKKGSMIKSVAIAGTRKRGNTPIEDEAFKHDLIENRKEKHEFSFVKKNIQEMLSKLCIRVVSKNEQKIIQTTNLQHLYRDFSGILKKNIQDKEIIKTLHPTPATGGFPKGFSLKTLYHLETFDRGWYASPIGWIHPYLSRQIVAIRSTLIHDQTMHLFAGTGIVKGSQADKEWEELEQKMSQFYLW